MDGIERLVAGVGLAASWCIVGLAIVQVAIIVGRRLGLTSPAAGEGMMWLAVAVALLAIPHVLQRGAHVAVDALSARWSPRARTWSMRLALLCLVLPFALLLLWLSAPYAWTAFATGEGSVEVAGLGQRWVPKAMVPLFAVLLALQAVASLLRNPS